MNKWLLGTSLALIACGAHAQTATSTNVYAKVVSSCAAQSYTAGQFQYVLMDATGDLCTNATGGGGGAITGPLGTQTLAASVAVTDLSLQPGGAAYNALTGAIPAGTNNIGGVNPLVNQTAGLIQATKSAAVSVSTATTTQIIAASGSTVIYVTGWDLVTTLANNVTWESGDTGGSCANPVALTGAYPFAANGGATRGGGLGPVLVLPAGKALCMLTSAATQISGSVAAAQF